MGRLAKKIARTPIVQRGLAALAAGLMGAVKATTRWQSINGAVAAPAWRGERPVIVAFWHNRLAMMPVCWPSRASFHMLISSHPDGRLIADTVARFGIGTVAGSSTRGGGEAMRALVRMLKAGASVGVTPDGPRGPAMTVGDGVIALARLSGAPILPVAVAVSRRLVLDTWDRLIIPLPFGRGAVVWGEPVYVPRDTDDAALEILRQNLEGALSRASVAADSLVGHGGAAQEEQRDARA